MKSTLALMGNGVAGLGGGPPLGLFMALLAAVFALLFMPDVFAGTRIPGVDESDKLEAAGTLLRLVDTGLFSWGARIFAGICIFLPVAGFTPTLLLRFITSKVPNPVKATDVFDFKASETEAIKASRAVLHVVLDNLLTFAM